MNPRLRRFAADGGWLWRLETHMERRRWVYSTGTEVLSLNKLISPLRYDVIVRQEFIELLEREWDMFVEDQEAFIEQAKGTDYFKWFRDIAARYIGVHGDSVRTLRAFHKRVVMTGRLLENFDRYGFNTSFPVTLRRGAGAPTVTGKNLADRLYPLDGCHRLALLRLRGATELPPTHYRIVVSPDPVPDNTHILVRSLGLDSRRYHRFVALGYLDSECETAEEILELAARTTPDLVPEIQRILAVDTPLLSGIPDGAAPDVQREESIERSSGNKLVIERAPPLSAAKALETHARSGSRASNLRASRRDAGAKAAARVLNRARPGRRMRPSYLVIGAKRSGSTSLHEYLLQHPDVLAPYVTKGCRYFDVNFAKGWSWYLSHFPLERVAERHERYAARRPIVGESSPYYVFHPLAPARIAEALPDVRLVLVLRDPVVRAWSHYQYEVARGFERLELRAALDNEESRLLGEEERLVSDSRYQSFAHRHFSYLRRGLYAEQIRRVHQHVSPERLLVVSSEELFDQTGSTMAQVFDFLRLQPFTALDARVFKANQQGQIPKSVVDRLAAYYEEPNSELFELLGRSFPWTKPA